MTNLDATRERTPAPPAARFIDTLASEWTKLASLRSTYLIITLGIMLSIGMSALLAVVIGNEWDGFSEAERADFSPLWALFGFLFGQIVFAVLGVLAVGSEYSSGMIRVTFQATPRRGRVLAAKLAVVTCWTLIAGMVAAFGMFFTGQAIFAAYDAPTASLTEWDYLRGVLSVGAGLGMLPILGVALAILLRSTAAAITTVLAVTFVPQFFGDMLPSWWQEHVVSLLPGQAMESLMAGHLVAADDPMHRGPATAGIVVLGWFTLAIVSAYLVMKRRDA